MEDLGRVGVCRTWLAQPAVRPVPGEAPGSCGVEVERRCVRCGWLVAGGLPDRTLTVGLSCADSTYRFPVGGLKWDRYESGSLAYAHA